VQVNAEAMTDRRGADMLYCYRLSGGWLHLLIGLVLAFGQDLAFAATTETLSLERKIPLGDVAGRIDHLAVDLAHRRVLVAELGNNSVGVVGVAEGKVLHRIFGLNEPQGIGYVPSTDTIYVANAVDGTVHRYQGADFALLGTLKLGDDADNVRVDSRTNHVIVGYGGGALALIDGASGTKAGELRLAAHPESFQLERNGSRIFANVPDAQEIAVVDRSTKKQIAKWAVPDVRANFPMALDDAGQRLLVVYRKPALMAVFDTQNGNVVARIPTCGDADDLFYDAKRQRIYVSCGEGALAVVQRQGDTYRELGRIPIMTGARTSLWVPELDRLFLAVPASGNERAALWVYRPAGSRD
jgi:DNA-binding beta-propeller fold protein YncE